MKNVVQKQSNNIAKKLPNILLEVTKTQAKREIPNKMISSIKNKSFTIQGTVSQLELD